MPGQDPASFLPGLLAVIGLVLLNGFFVAAEFAIVKVRMTQIELLIREGRLMARVARGVIQKLDSYLSATQLGITLASLGLGWVGKPAVAVFTQKPLESMGLGAETIEGVSFAIAFSFITFLHIVVGELVPKSLAILRAESTVLAISGPLSLFYRASYPLIWFLDRSAWLILKPMGLGSLPGHERAYSEEELRLLLSRSHEKEVSHFARDLAIRALELKNRPVREIILPRTEIVFLSSQKSLSENLRIARESGFTRYPLCEGSIDQPIGMILIKDLLWRPQELPDVVDLAALKREIIFIPETLPIEEALSKFLHGRCHMAMVLDEYGGTVGMVTLEDVLEELVGEIQDESDHESPLIVAVPGAAGEYLAEGTVPLYQLNSLCDLTLKKTGVDTLSGYIIKVLGRIPNKNEELKAGGATLVIKKVGRRRIHQVLVRKKPGASGENEGART